MNSRLVGQFCPLTPHTSGVAKILPGVNSGKLMLGSGRNWARRTALDWIKIGFAWVSSKDTKTIFYLDLGVVNKILHNYSRSYISQIFSR